MKATMLSYLEITKDNTDTSTFTEYFRSWAWVDDSKSEEDS